MVVPPLKFRGSNCLRQRIILSLLSGKTVIIEDIRPDDDEQLNEYETNLLELVQRLTSGTKIQNKGNRLQFTPGSIIGGDLTHACHLDRSIVYYLELLFYLAPFCKKPLNATLTGVTDDQLDPTIEQLKASAIPILKRFIGDVEGTKLDIKVNARGFKPKGGGQVVFTCPVVRQLQPITLLEPGKVKRVRGVAVAARVSPQQANRMIDTSKGMLLQFIPDVYIYSDHNKGKASGLSPGFSITLSAETTEGCTYTASAVSHLKGAVPEDVAKEATCKLLMEINGGACVDSISQGLALTLMAFNQMHVSQLRMSPPTVYTSMLLKHLQQFSGVNFDLKPASPGSRQDEIVATCFGLGCKNLNRPTY